MSSSGTVTAGLTTALGVLAVATVLGLWRRWRDGQFRAATPRGEDRGSDLVGLGVRPGAAVTLLQFSTAFCAPCRATRRVCAEVAERFEGVEHIEVDAESHLDAVRRLDVWRTPTVLVVDRGGRVLVHRATGTPSKAQVIATIAGLLPAGAAR